MESASWEDRVEPGTKAAGALLSAMHADLDDVLGGFGWWSGYTDQRRVALLSEYLMSSISGVSHALASASLQATTLAEKQFADAMWIHTRCLDVARTNPAASNDDFLASIQRGPSERRRMTEIEAAREHVFFHLAQTMDRLAASIIGVAALHVDIIRADWNDIRYALRRMDNGGKRPLDDPGTDGRLAQEDLLKVIRSAVVVGPVNWMEWMLRQRDTAAHRAPKTSWMLLVSGGAPDPRTVFPFYRQPGWSEVEAMASTGVNGGPNDLLIMREPQQIVDHFVEHVTGVVEAAMIAMKSLWDRRRRERTLLVQPGVQWPNVMEHIALQFDGFDASPLHVVGETIFTSPETSTRMSASKVMDSDRAFWRP
ncbi:MULTISPECIES: hypothetical protein [unclassified Nocardioides]|uniref:hypothetical protein n=1 Tax=unclassified Nocardioides TaxID=2615069 RepID=UPI0009F0CA16|nr:MULTISPECIES: hypothetical protein [unclassified Nocardioides]GAW48099.1 uncharacterized protein PD653B2_0412 [Nocardioides sp. PD653-B2]GAW53598.1 uncharacterized protein PD653_0999 [Nocardioides sp. PD653]